MIVRRHEYAIWVSVGYEFKDTGVFQLRSIELTEASSVAAPLTEYRRDLIADGGVDEEQSTQLRHLGSFVLNDSLIPPNSVLYLYLSKAVAVAEVLMLSL